jgi:hypothetical protein
MTDKKNLLRMGDTINYLDPMRDDFRGQLSKCALDWERRITRGIATLNPSGQPKKV